MTVAEHTAGPTNPRLDAALAYARRGWWVVPLDEARGLHVERGTVDAGELRAHWARWPDANVGVLLGGHLVALRATTGRVATASLARLQDVAGLGPCHVLGPDGPTWLFSCGTAPASVGLLPGVSLLSDGLVVLPPSSGPGGAWQWRKGAERKAGVTPLTDALHRLATDPAARAALVAGEPAPGDAPAGPDDDWAFGLPRDRGQLKNTFAVACAILRGAPPYKGRLAFDQMRLQPCLDGKELTDGALGALREGIELKYGLSPGADNLLAAIRTVAEERAYHPVRRYLEALPPWDGVPRIARVAAEVLGATPTALVQATIRKWCIATVARPMRPGCQVDTALVLVGNQGALKSTFFRTLAGPYFGDSHMDIENKDSKLQLHAVWLYEWAEIENVTSRKQAEAIKAFVTIREDLLRPPYARAVSLYPRAGVIVGSTNKPRFLNDPTGSRRFWTITVGADIHVARLAGWRDQLWAEALAAFQSGEPWHFDREMDVVRARAAEAHQVHDPWEDVVGSWLVEEWPSLQTQKVVPKLTSHIIGKQALALMPRDMGQAFANRLGDVMGRLGYCTRRARLTKDEQALWKALTGQEKRLVWEWVRAADAGPPGADDDDGGVPSAQEPVGPATGGAAPPAPDDPPPPEDPHDADVPPF